MPTRRDLANAIRALSMDAVQQANSGHPGAPMGMADIAEVLWNDFLCHSPANPEWADRDRFVLSNGHGSMLLYSLLHLSGYSLPLGEIRNFRQLHSKTPGHPEYGLTPGVETTTGPLGQGFANAVGMALAERGLAARFNHPDHEIVDHYTYVSVGDGCLMEGISHEAASLAGTQGLGKLIAIYDDNGISIDGDVSGWFTEHVPKRFEAYNWHVIAGVDGHDAAAVHTALEAARAETGRPSLICCKTIIGWGAPNKQGSEAAHGSVLGAEEVALARERMGWPHEAFHVPPEIYAGWDARAAGAAREADWQRRFDAYRHSFPEDAAELQRRLAGLLPASWPEASAGLIKQIHEEAASSATRKASQRVLNGYGPVLRELIGGSADLADSNNTLWSESNTVNSANPGGNYLYFGVREFAMSAMLNGLALHGGFIPYGGTFLTFSDYARNAVRMAALMGARSLFVYTHDSVGLGEDGPTHQSVEHAASLRLIPGLSVWRPCDAVETAIAWKAAIERSQGPTALLLSRQGVPHQDRTGEQLASIHRGGYVLREVAGEPDAIVIATGSEVDLAMQAALQLAAEGEQVRVVSMPSVDSFEAQDEAYKAAVLPAATRARVAIEAGVPDSWYRYVGPWGDIIGIDRFGESAPGAEVMAYLGFTVEQVVSRVKKVLAGCRQAIGSNAVL